VRFSLAGDGKLIDNQGTSMGSRKVQLYNGRAMIKVKTNEGISVVSVQSEGIPTMLINLNSGTTITEEANSSE
jgi:beta-galactosidase